MEEKKLEIKEYKIITREGYQGKQFYSIQLDENFYYANYEETHIKTTNDIEFATRYHSKENAQSEINLLKNHFDQFGKRK